MNEAVSKVVDGFMRSKSRDAIVVCFLFGMGWMLSPWMALFAAGLYFKLMRNKASGWGINSGAAGHSSRRQILPHFQTEQAMQYQPQQQAQHQATSSKMEAKDWLILVGVALYVLSPIDIVPDLPIVGWFDDAALVGWAIKHFTAKFGKKDLPPPAAPGHSLSVRPNDPSFDDDAIDVEAVEMPRRRRRA